jgi:uncharacterized membrane protein YcaP (DUF421 family)
MSDSHLPFSLFLVALSARTAVVATLLIAGLRFLGKRQLGQMNIYDLALVMLVANAVQNAMTEGDGHLAGGIVCAGTLLLLGAVLTYVFLRQPRLEQRLVGIPTVIIRDGEIQREAARRERVTHDEIMQVLRGHDICEVCDVRLAVLEADGTLSVVPYPEQRSNGRPAEGAEEHGGQDPSAGETSPDPKASATSDSSDAQPGR